MLPLTPLYTQSRGGGGTDPDDALGTYAVVATICFTLLVFLFESYLSLRQKASYRKTEFPQELQSTVGIIDAERAKELSEADAKQEEDEKKEDEREDDAPAAEEPATGEEEEAKAKVDRNAPLLPQLQGKFQAAQSYGLDKSNFSLVSSAYGTIEGVAFLLLGFMPWVWDYACHLGRARFGGWTEGEDEIKISLVFLLVTTLIGTLTGLPFELYSTFRIEKKHGFNKQTLGLFFTDKVKGFALTLVFGGPFVALLLKIIQMGGDKFYLYVWAFTCVFSLIMMTLVPIVIMPLFNKVRRTSL